jgi:hypothetical protein
LVYNHGFEENSKSQKTYQREFFAGFFMKIDGSFESFEITMTDFFDFEFFPKNRN